MNFIIKNKDGSRYIRLGYIVFALVTAVLYELFFWKQQNGIAFPIFVIIYSIGFLILSVLTNQLRQRAALLLLLPILVLSFDVVLYNNDLVSFWLTKIVFILSVIFSILITLDNPNRHKFSFRNIPIIGKIDLTFTKWGEMYRDLFSWNQDKDKDVVRKIAIGLIISVPVLFVFVLLFIKADAVFHQSLKNIFVSTHGWSWLFRIFRVFAFTIFISSFFYVILSAEHILGQKEHRVFKLDKVIVGVLLSLVNALFLMFVFVQFKYLFGTSNFVLENGLAYADYARKGFFELAWVVALAALLVIVVYRSFVHHGVSKVITFFQALLIAQVGVVAVSALTRMNLYQDVYGYTVLRLYVEWFIYFILAVLAFTILSLIFKITFRKFLYTNLILGVIAFTAVASVNVDKLIAEENTNRFLEEGKELDLAYLDSLSTDIWPIFENILKENNLKKLSIQDQLYLIAIQEKKGEKMASRKGWREFHISDYFNRYVNIPSESREYEYIKVLKERNIKYAELETELKPSIVGNCIYGDKIKLPYSVNKCQFGTTKEGRHFIHALEIVEVAPSTTTEQSRESSAKNIWSVEFKTNLHVYEVTNLSSAQQEKYVKVFTKSFPVYKITNNYYSNTDQKYSLLLDGRILERSSDELKHFFHSVIVNGNQFNLVRSNSVEN